MIEGIPVIGLTAPTLLGIAILLLLTGRLIPRSALLDKSKECDQWREAYEKERDARSLSDHQTVQMLEGLKTNHAVIEAMFESIQQHIQGAGGSNVLPKA